MLDEEKHCPDHGTARRRSLGNDQRCRAQDACEGHTRPPSHAVHILHPAFFSPFILTF